ncbi:MAG: radical SAM protein [Candidatus Heimdallarchaeaceae archaeon]
MSQGYIQEIFSSFQGEGAAIEGSCYGLRQIFVRFSGCPLAMKHLGTEGCVWCDSPKAKNLKIKECLIEKEAGGQTFEKIFNPISADNVLKIIENLSTPDLHSISLTGGEPLLQTPFIEEIAQKLKKRRYNIFLETAYTENLTFLEKITQYIDFACVDFKDRTANAAENWKKLVEQEFHMSSILKKGGVKVYGKTVITKSSKKEDFEVIAELCGQINLPLAIQIVSPIKTRKVMQPSWKQVQEFAQVAAKYLPPEKIGISIQMHKCINIL